MNIHKLFLSKFNLILNELEFKKKVPHEKPAALSTRKKNSGHWSFRYASYFPPSYIAFTQKIIYFILYFSPRNKKKK